MSSGSLTADPKTFRSDAPTASVRRGGRTFCTPAGSSTTRLMDQGMSDKTADAPVRCRLHPIATTI